MTVLEVRQASATGKDNAIICHARDPRTVVMTALVRPEIKKAWNPPEAPKMLVLLVPWVWGGHKDRWPIKKAWTFWAVKVTCQLAWAIG